MELPRPIFQSFYDKIVKKIAEGAEVVAKSSMSLAAKREKKLTVSDVDFDENDLETIQISSDKSITVSGDGSWRKRGFNSLFRLVSLIGWCTSKVVAVIIKSNYCKSCEYWKNKTDTAGYEEWLKSHEDECQANHNGSAATRRLRHYRSGLRALRRGRRPRQRGSVAQPEQHELSASRAASRRGAGEIHSRAAEQGRGGARRQALLPDHMSVLKEEIVLTRFRAREYQTAVRDLLGTFCNLNRLLDYVNYPLEPSEYWWQLDEQLSQELDGIDTIFGNLWAPLSS
ncbi:unnamed protein product [Trichogramma brassicae]|uniref:Mutator-like transposase domain-containing protein n=1 Tax=Trichogramma brassicae TaxID=86971 RepID=A0A6H5HWX9_9HYME|nr:unnamed protein product [Trichogramma brassicae]